ncbi:MAG: secondary thiamine-phosphate synthase enzyme YjbQ [Calditrichia bacterium]
MVTIETKSLSISTHGFTDIIDITSGIQQMVSESDFREGQVLVFVSGSTAALTTVEFEPGLQKDLKEFFEEWIPMSRRYHHNDTWHDGNGYAHVRASMLKPSLTIPFTDKRLCLGTWQQVIFLDFDNRSRSRNLVVQILGEIGE